jgi:uncharacterized membrane protein (DUF2068 family)
MKFRGEPVVRLIALFRIAKAILLILSGLAVLKLLRPGAMETVMRWANQVQFPAVQRGIAKLTSLPPRRIEELATATFLYAALFITEGAGLWMGKVWAEWLTIVATTSFIPFELYEAMKKPTMIRVGLVVLNTAIVIYLLHLRLRRRRLK